VESGLDEMLAADLDLGFDAMVRHYQHQLYAFALSLSGRPADAEDVAQEAFVRAYRALARYPAQRRRELKLRPWLHRIALNCFRNRIRRRRLHIVPLELAAEAADDGWGRPEQEAMRGADRSMLLDALGTLPDRQREAVVLRSVEGLPYAEASAVLGRPVGTVKSDVHRGLLALRAMLVQEEIA
jgi:RNA polymerase sigma-70 factor (ECF subfamily)